MNNQVKNLCLSAMLIALAIIATKVIGINPGFSFVRISFGPALIIFASLYLGPIYGLVIGAASDFLGAIIFPTGPYEPLFTLVYGFLGVLPWVLNLFIKKIKNAEIARVFYNILVFFLVVVLVSSAFLYPQIDNEVLMYLYGGLSIIFAIALAIVSDVLNTRFAKKDPEYDNKFYHYGIVCVLTEVVCMVLLNSLVKSIHFELPYMLIFEWMSLLAFINIPINTFAVFYLEKLAKRIMHRK